MQHFRAECFALALFAEEMLEYIGNDPAISGGFDIAERLVVVTHQVTDGITRGRRPVEHTAIDVGDIERRLERPLHRRQQRLRVLLAGDN
ncbi:MAG: hypothetical protein H0T71_11675 [Acidobacteria bacterium]|nr:hypothetical protein [Acidobacteriota bacterium]